MSLKGFTVLICWSECVVLRYTVNMKQIWKKKYQKIMACRYNNCFFLSYVWKCNKIDRDKCFRKRMKHILDKLWCTSKLKSTHRCWEYNLSESTFTNYITLIYGRYKLIIQCSRKWVIQNVTKQVDKKDGHTRM